MHSAFESFSLFHSLYLLPLPFLHPFPSQLEQKPLEIAFFTIDIRLLLAPPFLPASFFTSFFRAVKSGRFSVAVLTFHFDFKLNLC
jgi:hypothetical protein